MKKIFVFTVILVNITFSLFAQNDSTNSANRSNSIKARNKVVGNYYIKKNHSKKLPDCNYIFTNNSWEHGVWIQYKLGSQSNCPEKPDAGEFKLEKGQSKTILSGLDLCWRRDSRPGEVPRSEWSTWNSEPCFGGNRKINIQ